jgi:preprotein translocase subunit SecE
MSEKNDEDENEPSEDTDEADSSDEEEEESPREETRRASDDRASDDRASDGRASEDEDAGGMKTLGLQRWVQFAFVGIAIVTFFVVDKLITLVWDYFAEPMPLVASAVGAVVGMLTGFGLYRYPKVKTLADEVAGELAKVTWPSRKETWYSSVVVIVTSIIAAIYVGLFDAAWSAVTDFIYSLS